MLFLSGLDIIGKVKVKVGLFFLVNMVLAYIFSLTCQFAIVPCSTEFPSTAPEDAKYPLLQLGDWVTTG